MYWLLRLENVVVCLLHGMGGSSRCSRRRHCWLALTEMEMILGWERGNHYAAAVVAAVVKGVVEAVRVAFGPVVQDSRPRLLRPVLQRCCQWIRSNLEKLHCLNMPH